MEHTPVQGSRAVAGIRALRLVGMVGNDALGCDGAWDPWGAMECESAFRVLLGDDPYEALFKRLRLGAGDDLLGDFEQMAIWVYTTGAAFHVPINTALVTGRASEAIATVTLCLCQALQKLLPYRGYVYRGIRVPDLDAFKQRYRIGAIVTWPAFTSTSALAAAAFVGNVNMRILSLTGRLLLYYSSQDGEAEVLFAPGLQVEVMDWSERDGVLYLDLQERP
ncbi:ADP-ribosyltransferase domain-containing protein [Prosthecomicrobium hirschii]|uniref:ADP-ribosyltransferase domain-containing protein n=1 Tax=Prosthecodimorpha hirschii TaxID=665126 RepID=UPI00222029C9|nr:ADP-ribosyltransferase domain-containing protein [Prosthecomicrobium hirschii]MCW1840230.1 ADP-ribosyltransferase domain-containing protein [Prosthecomicrobium hirschii]